jgi:hypothetical protein
MRVKLKGKGEESISTTALTTVTKSLSAERKHDNAHDRTDFVQECLVK